MPASQILARAAAHTRWESLPKSAQTRAAHLCLDTLAIIAAAAAHPGHAQLAAAHAADIGPCTIIGLGQKLSAPSAALINGAATTVLQWQDGHRLARGHPASHLVPVLLALAEPANATASATMAAFVAGYEVGTRIGMALGGMQPDLHDAGNWATIGAAAAAAHLLSGGDETIINHAINGAAAMALFPWAQTPLRGATMHHLYIGQGAAMALSIARAAMAGLTGDDETLPQFFGPRAGAAFDPETLATGINQQGQWHIFQIESGYLKWHQACAHASGAADAMAQLLAAHPLKPEDITAIRVESYAKGLHYNIDLPLNDLAARFSLRAVLAAQLIKQPLSNALLDDPATKALMAKISTHHDPALDKHYPAGRPARVTIRMAGGQRHEAMVIDAYGDAQRPLTETDRKAKLTSALSASLGKAAAHVPLAFQNWLDGAPLAELMASLHGLLPAPPAIR